MFGYLGLFRDSDVRDAIESSYDPEMVGRWAWWGNFKSRVVEYVRNKKHINKNLRSVINSNTTENPAESSAASPVESAFASVQPVYIYTPGDMASAISNFAYEFGEYFSREMAAKHPGVTTVSFAIPSVYLITIAMANIGIAPHIMHSIYTTMSKILSIDGHLIDPNKITHVFQVLDDKWQWLTGYEGFVETLIMTAFGAPKIIYIGVEQLNKIISDIPETTISEVSKVLSSGQLDTQLTSDEVREKLKSVVKITAMLGLAAALGVGASVLPNSLPGAAFLKSVVKFFDNVQYSGFAACAHASSVLAELGDLAQLSAQVKTAGLLLVKVFGISHFLRVNHEEEDARALVYFKALQAREQLQQWQQDNQPNEAERNQAEVGVDAVEFQSYKNSFPLGRV